MNNEQAKQLFKPIIMALTIVGAFSLIGCINSNINVETFKQQGVICNLTEYNPETAKLDIDSCRKLNEGKL